MNIIRSWREQMVLLKWKFPFLKDTDFHFEEGHRESMLESLAIRLNKTRSELDILFAELQHY